MIKHDVVLLGVSGQVISALIPIQVLINYNYSIWYLSVQSLI